MRALFDVNVLIALFDPSHVHHHLAHAWLAANSESGWASCPLTENGFVRIMCQPNYPNAISTTDAIGRMRIATDQPGHQFWPDEVSLIDSAFFDANAILGPKKISNIYLLGLAVKNGGRLVTFDRNITITAVAGAEDRNLVILGNG